jgi:hypothetical protein
MDLARGRVFSRTCSITDLTLAESQLLQAKNASTGAYTTFSSSIIIIGASDRRQGQLGTFRTLLRGAAAE